MDQNKLPNEMQTKDWQIGQIDGDDLMIDKEDQNVVENDVVNEMYLGSKSSLRNLKKKNHLYSRDTLNSTEKGDVNEYEKFKEEIRKEFNREKEERVRGKSLEISRISNVDKSVTNFYDGKKNKNYKILSELKEAGSAKDGDMGTTDRNFDYNSGRSDSNLLDDLGTGDTNYNFKNSGSLLSFESSQNLASARRPEKVSIREELRSRKLEMIEERQSEEERNRGFQTERERNVSHGNNQEPGYRHDGGYESNLMRVKSENIFSRRYNAKSNDHELAKIFGGNSKKEVIEEPSITGIKSNLNSINYKRRDGPYNLDESSKIYNSFYNKTNDMGYNSIELKARDVIPAYKYHELLSRFNKLEIEKGELEKENLELKNEMNGMVETIKQKDKEIFMVNSKKSGMSIPLSDYRTLEERASKLKSENESLQKQLFQMNVRKFSEMDFSGQRSNQTSKADLFRSYDQRKMQVSRSKSRGKMFVSPQGVVSPFNEENYFSLQKEKVRTERSKNRELSKKVKFADSVVSMVKELVQNQAKVNLKTTWHMLKKVLKEYFKMKNRDERPRYEGNLPTAVKDNRIYGDLTKDHRIEGYKSERIDKKFRSDLRGASPQNAGGFSYRVEPYRDSKSSKKEIDAKYMSYMNVRKDR